MALPEPLKRPADAGIHGLIHQQAKGQRAALADSDLVHLIEQGIQMLQDREQMPGQVLTRTGELDRVARAVKQLRPQFSLQRRHLAADRRLGDILLLRGHSKALALGNDHKGSQLGNGQGNFASFSLYYVIGPCAFVILYKVQIRKASEIMQFCYKHINFLRLHSRFVHNIIFSSPEPTFGCAFC